MLTPLVEGCTFDLKSAKLSAYVPHLMALNFVPCLCQNLNESTDITFAIVYEIQINPSQYYCFQTIILYI